MTSVPGESAALEAAAELGSLDSVSPAIAWDGTNFLVVWTDHSLGNGDILAARISPAGEIISTLAVSEVLGDQDTQPSVAFNGTDFLVVWQRGLSSSQQYVRAARISKMGARLGSPFNVSTSGVSTQPRVAASGAMWLVVWEEGWGVGGLSPAGVGGTRISASGQVLDPASWRVITADWFGAWGQTVFAHQGGWVVAWVDNRGRDRDTYYALVAKNGTVSDPGGCTTWPGRYCGLLLSGSDYADLAPAGRSLGTQALITWTNTNAVQSEIRGVRLDANGRMIDPVGGFRIVAGTKPGLSAVETADASHWMVLWSQQGTGRDIAGRTVSSATALGTVQSISTASGNQTLPALARGIGGFLAVWQDGRALTTSGQDIYGRRLTTRGVPNGTEVRIR